jgi:hypothetical protein
VPADFPPILFRVVLVQPSGQARPSPRDSVGTPEETSTLPLEHEPLLLMVLLMLLLFPSSPTLIPMPISALLVLLLLLLEVAAVGVTFLARGGLCFLGMVFVFVVAEGGISLRYANAAASPAIGVRLMSCHFCFTFVERLLSLLS